MLIFFALIPLFLTLVFLALRFTLFAPAKSLPAGPSEHDKALIRIDQLEYDLRIGPGGQRRFDEEMAAVERASTRLERGSTDIRDWATAKGVDLAAHEMAELAQANPEEYWRRVAWDAWRQAGHPPAPPRV